MKDREQARRKAEKEEYGIVVPYAVIWCAQPPPPTPPQSCAPLHLPASMVIRDGGTEGSPPTHTPFGQFEATAVDL
jgi:hypothetical protein